MKGLILKNVIGYEILDCYIFSYITHFKRNDKYALSFYILKWFQSSIMHSFHYKSLAVTDVYF